MAENCAIVAAHGEMNSVSITCLKVADRSPPSRWWQTLSPAEQKRADAFRFPSDRNAYISAHALLRHKLAIATGLEAADLRFVHDDFGKPTLVNSSATPGFNLSHTRGMVAVATAANYVVGVDVEASTRAVSSYLAIAEQNFTSREVSALGEIRDADSRRAFFFWLWTRKEAVLKATGKGLSLPLNSFCVIADCDHTVSFCLSCDPPFQAALSSKSLNGFCAAAAVLTLEDVLPDFVWEEVAGKSVLALDVP